MTEQKSVVCPSCSKTVTVDAAASELFCPYCGTRFEAGEETAESGEALREAYENGEYARVVDETDSAVFERNRALGLLRTASEYYVARERYFAAARELASKRRAKSGLARLFLGRDEYADSPIHKQWFEDAERLCSSLAAQAGECLDGPNEALAQRLPLDIVRSLLDYKKEKDEGALYWPAVAVEHFAIPLLGLLQTDDLRALYDDYGSYYKKYERLPNQERTLAEMKKELEKR